MTKIEWAEKVLQKIIANIDIQPDGCWEWGAGLFTSGYAQVRIGNKKYRGHRLMWELLNGKIPRDKIICHACDNPKCLRPAHLFIGTHQDNADDRGRKGRTSMGVAKPIYGEKNGSAKLCAHEVREIVSLHAGGDTVRYIARIYRVSRGTIYNIIRGRTWQIITRL